MPYTSPTITASGGTYAQLKTQALRGRLAALIAANPGLSARQRVLVQGHLGNDVQADPIRHFDVTLSAWLKGEPVATADFQQQLLDCTTAVKALLTAMEEICVHVDANPGTITNAQTGVLHAPRRTLA